MMNYHIRAIDTFRQKNYPGNPVCMSDDRIHTIENLKEYLCTWFFTIDQKHPTHSVDAKIGKDIIVLCNKSYVLVASYKRMKVYHGVYVDLSTGKYLFALDGKYRPRIFPYVYDSYEDLIHGVAAIYEKLWNV